MKLKDAEKKIRQLFGTTGFANMIPRAGCEIGNDEILIEANTFEECFKKLDTHLERIKIASQLLHAPATVLDQGRVVEVKIGDVHIVAAESWELAVQFLQGQEPHRAQQEKAKNESRRWLGSLGFVERIGRLWKLGLDSNGMRQFKAAGRTPEEAFRNLRVVEEKELVLSRKLRKQYEARRHMSKHASEKKHNHEEKNGAPTHTLAESDSACALSGSHA